MQADIWGNAKPHVTWQYALAAPISRSLFSILTCPTPLTIPIIPAHTPFRMKSNVRNVPGFASLIQLRPAKLRQLDTVLKSILALPIAQDTYAHIMDTKPAKDSLVVNDASTSDDQSPSHEAQQRYKEFRDGFTAQTLKLDTEVR